MSDAAGDDRSRLVWALSLSRRFHLYLALVGSPRAADQFLGSMSAELEKLGREGARVVRLNPYAGRGTAAPLEDAELADRVLVPLLDPREDLRGAIHVVDASRATYADTDAWARAFSLWNEKRNILRGDRGEVIVMLPRALGDVFTRVAPDVWSIRSGEYVLAEDVSQCEVVSGASLFDPRLLVSAVPPLALFGGDLVVQPWADDFLLPRGVLNFWARMRTSMAQKTPEEVARQRYTLAATALSERRFGDAETLFSELLNNGALNLLRPALVPLPPHVRAGLCVALIAQDRAHEALRYTNMASLVFSKSASGHLPAIAGALASWCLGRLAAAEHFDEMALGRRFGLSRNRSSHGLRLAERGLMLEARSEVASLIEPSTAHENTPSLGEPKLARLLSADLDVLLGDTESAHVALGSGSAPEHRQRTHLALALVEIARGNGARATYLLSSSPLTQDPASPDESYRTSAFHAYASGILSAVNGDRQVANDWFEHARGFIAAWGRSSLDRRSRLRADAMVDLCLTQLQPDGDRAVEMARALVPKTVSLLGDTGEDCIARAITVLVHGELARRLAAARNAGAPEAARHALALAQPFTTLDVPAWTAVLRDAEHRLAAIEGPPPPG